MEQKRVDLILTAFSQIGEREIKGVEDNPEVLKYFNELGYNGSKLKDETAWCAAFASWVCKKVGACHSDYLNARSFLNVGYKVDKPKIGDIVVFWRESPDSWKGHVAFFIRETENEIYVLGGNQNNEVSIKPYSKKRFLEYRNVL